jgi:transposase
MEIELEELEGRKERVERERDERVREVYKKGDKKLEKLAGKEEKIANRILWIVVMKMGGNVGDELVDVGSLEG